MFLDTLVFHLYGFSIRLGFIFNLFFWLFFFGSGKEVARMWQGFGMWGRWVSVS